LLFKDLNLIEPILRSLETEGYTTPTPIQEKAIPIALSGKDLLGAAQTGTGKTAAFAIPILQQLHKAKQVGKQYKSIKALILTPTRELAIQIDDSIAAYGRHLDLKHLVIYGGVAQNAQITALRTGIDILVATPGRLLDFMEQGFINLAFVKIFVLDEADRMLDMGFIYDVKAIIAKLPEKRQTLFFSATMPNEIAKLADSILHEPVRVEVTPVSSTAKTIVQSMYFVEKADKTNLLIHLLSDKTIERVLVFTRTKHGADKVVNELKYAGIQAEAIHGNKSQNARQKALANFKSGETPVLVATDIAARGIDVENLTHVINYGLPSEPETYIHRIGRTGRAGSNGIALSFCDREEMGLLRDIQKLLRKTVPVVKNHPFQMAVVFQGAHKKSPKNLHKACLSR
jgi:ATP-dependent RNA helicase RhlE